MCTGNRRDLCLGGGLERTYFCTGMSALLSYLCQSFACQQKLWYIGSSSGIVLLVDLPTRTLGVKSLYAPSLNYIWVLCHVTFKALQHGFIDFNMSKLCVGNVWMQSSYIYLCQFYPELISIWRPAYLRKQNDIKYIKVYIQVLSIYAWNQYIKQFLNQHHKNIKSAYIFTVVFNESMSRTYIHLLWVS